MEPTYGGFTVSWNDRVGGHGRFGRGCGRGNMLFAGKMIPAIMHTCLRYTVEI